jgi:heat shock protein HtpX
MFLSQMVSSIAIVEGFRQMNCVMSGYIWGYFALISGSLVFLGVVQIVFDKHVKGLEISDARFMRELSSDLGCEIYLLDTQRVKAFAHRRRIYLSVGLVELLEPNEIRAVASHELYHAKHTPNRLLANSLAVSSLWLRSYRDDASADKYASEVAGRENLISAFEKLNVVGAERRIKRLSS